MDVCELLWGSSLFLAILDEPELGLHPYALTLLAELLKKAAMKTQVIVSTQSASLLDNFQAEDVIVVEREDADLVAFSLTYRLTGEVSQVRERYELTEGKVSIDARIEGTLRPCCFRVPLWLSDGHHRSAPEVLPSGFRVVWQGHEYSVACAEGAVMQEGDIANRNGVYRLGRIEAVSPALSLTLRLAWGFANRDAFCCEKANGQWGTR